MSVVKTSTDSAHGGMLGALAEPAGARSTGVLTVVKRNHRRLFCFDRGDLIFATSNVIEEQFGVTLSRIGTLPEDAVVHATRMAAERKQKLTNLLQDSKLVDMPALSRAMEQHVRWLLEDTLGWDKTDISFAKGRPRLEDEPLAKLNGARLVLELARQAKLSEQALRIGIGPPDSCPLLVRRRRRLFADTATDSVTDFLIAQCSGETSIDSLVANFDGPANDVLRGLYGLRLLGMIEPHSPETSKPEDNLPTYRECVARYDASEGVDHYVVLGLTRSSERSHVREAYYYLAKRFHPDRLRTDELLPLSERSENYFAKVTEAYNTLYEPELREAYDNQIETASQQPERDPTTDSAYIARQNFARGKMLLEKSRYQDAIQFLENAVEQDDSFPAYHLELGRVLIRNPRRREDAEKFLLGALDLDPTLAEAYLALGQLYLKTGRDAEAENRFREVLRWDPHHAVAKSELADMGLKPTADGGSRRRGWFKK